MERLTIKAPSGLIHLDDNEADTINRAIKKLSDYEDLEEQGLLLRLPCKRGNIVYFIKSAFSIAAFPIEAKVASICGVDCDNEVMYSAITNYNGLERKFKSSDIGKTVFFTQEEAESALEKMKGE